MTLRSRSTINTTACVFVLLSLLVLTSAPVSQARMVRLGLKKFFGWTYGAQKWQGRPVKPGDILVFRWLGQHDLHWLEDKAAYDTCDGSRAIQLLNSRFYGVYKFVVPTESRKKYSLYFASLTGEDCEKGMKAAVRVG